nr:MAG TPA: hypothetical protein [Caudoviricetes sp.]
MKLSIGSAAGCKRMTTGDMAYVYGLFAYAICCSIQRHPLCILQLNFWFWFMPLSSVRI